MISTPLKIWPGIGGSMDKIVFGKYIPLDTPIHALDPRAKIIAMLVVLIAIFLPAGWLGYALIALAVGLVILLAKIRFKVIFRAFKPMLFMMIFLLVVNILSTKEGILLVDIDIFGAEFTIYSEAIIDTLYIVVRLLLMIMITTILTMTTKPLDLTLGIEYLLTPLKVIHVPAHEIAMMISIALRFIPTIIEETMRIMNAQKSRGVDFEEGKLKEKISAIVSLIVPLFSGSLQRADELANAMEARGYAPDGPRTRYRRLQYALRDYILLAGAVIILAVMVVLAFVI